MYWRYRNAVPLTAQLLIFPNYFCAKNIFGETVESVGIVWWKCTIVLIMHTRLYFSCPAIAAVYVCHQFIPLIWIYMPKHQVSKRSCQNASVKPPVPKRPVSKRQCQNAQCQNAHLKKTFSILTQLSSSDHSWFIDLLITGTIYDTTKNA